MKLELAYQDIGVHYINHYTKGTFPKDSGFQK